VGLKIDLREDPTALETLHKQKLSPITTDEVLTYVAAHSVAARRDRAVVSHHLHTPIALPTFARGGD
jgi:hypothetical protein